MPHDRSSTLRAAKAARGLTSPSRSDLRPTHVPQADYGPPPASLRPRVRDQVELRLAPDGTGDGVLTTRAFAAGETVMVGYLVNLTIDHFPTVCLCGATGCRGSVTGWKDLPQDRKDAYGALVAPYLLAIDAE